MNVNIYLSNESGVPKHALDQVILHYGLSNFEIIKQRFNFVHLQSIIETTEQTVPFVEGVDVNVLPQKMPIPKLFVADMDSTMIGQECIDELADYVGVKAEVSDVTERAMRGELDFEAALRKRVQLLGGVSESVLQVCFDERITPNAGAKELLVKLNANGVRTVLVSGGFTFFASRIANYLGFDKYVANQFEISDGRLTGDLCGQIVDRLFKRTELQNHAQELGILKEEIVAIGDGSNDLDMLESAGYKVAYRAKPVLRSVANIHLDHSALDILPEICQLT